MSRRMIIVAVVGCTMMVIGLGVWDWFLRAHHFAQEVADLTNGGEAYPYIYADPSDLKEGKEAARVWIGSAGGPTYYVSIWISPAEANRDANDGRYWSLNKYKTGKPLIYKGAVLLGYEIPPGDYFVEMSARNGTVVERLTIENGRQKMTLQRDGKPLFLPAAAIEPELNRRD